MGFILPRFLRPRGSDDPSTPNNESDVLINIATGMARQRGRRSGDRYIPPAPSAPAPSLPDFGTLRRIESLTAQGGIDARPTTPNNPRPALPGQSPFVFSVYDAVPQPATRPRRRRPRRSKPARRGRPTRPTRPARPQDPRIPESPVTEPARRSTPSRRPIPIPTSVPGALFDLWKQLWDAYVTPRREPSPSGGPRRGGERTRQPPSPGPVTVPMPGPLEVELPTPARRAEPGEIFQTPAAVPSPFPDPSTFPATLPAPSPAARAPAARTRGLLQLGSPLPWSVPQVRQRNARRPRSSQPRNPRRTTDYGRLNTTDPLSPTRNLTGLQPGRVELPAQSSNPCQQLQRDAKRRQRRRRKECKKFVYKRIKVCQSSNVK